MFGFGCGAFAEGGFDGFAQRVSAFECFEEEEVFAGEALVVDGVVVAVDGEVYLLACGAAGAGTADEMNADGVAGLCAGVVRRVADGEEGVVDGVGCGEETEIRLQSDVGVGVETGDFVCSERRAGFVIEGFDVGPFEGGHRCGGVCVGMRVLRVLLEPDDERGAEIAEGEGARGMGFEVGAHEGLKSAAAYDGLEAWEVLFEGGEESEPVLTVVDFETLEGGEAIVGADEGGGLVGYGWA